MREPRLRWPVDAALNSKVQGRTVLRVYRQAKYVVLVLSGECYVLIHLGMSGSVRVLPATTLPHGMTISTCALPTKCSGCMTRAGLARCCGARATLASTLGCLAWAASR